jgi:hypothetical protein
MIRLTTLLALCLLGSPARADDLDVIVDKTASAESRGQAYYRLTSAEFAPIAAKLARLIGHNSVFTGIGPATQEPWKEAQLSDHDRIGCTLRQLWRKHFETRRPRGENVELLFGLLEDPSVGRGRHRVAVELVACLRGATLAPDPSMPPMQDILRRLERLVQDPKEPEEPEAVRSYVLDLLFVHGDQNKYLDLAIRLTSTGDKPMRRAELFRSCTQACRPGKLSEENRRKFLCHGYRLLEEIDDGHSGSGYFLAVDLGLFIGIAPVRTGQSSFMPDSRLPEYQGPHGLTETFFQDTVNNARKWREENKVACNFEETPAPRPSP